MGIGTMFWGNSRLDERMAGRIIPDETLLRIGELSSRHGVNFFDTAEGYGVGSSETRLARLGFTAPSENKLVATKFLPTLWRWTPESFVRATEASNRRLKVGTCALSFIHSPVHPRSPNVWIRGAARAFRQGKLQALGLSNFDADQVRSAFKVAQDEGIPLVANQLMFSLLVYRSTRLQETVHACRETGLQVIGYGGLGQGLLTSTLTQERFESNRLARRMKLTRSELDPLRDAIGAVAARHGRTMAQVSLQWIRHKGVIPLVGTRTVEQIEDSLGALDFSITEDEAASLDDAALSFSTFDRPMWRRALFLAFLSVLVASTKLSRGFRSGHEESPQISG